MLVAVMKPSWLILVLVTFAIDVCSGLGGLTFALLLRLVQHVAYGHGPHTMAGQQTFLQEVTAASDFRRFPALCSCGAVAGNRLVAALSFWYSVGFYPPGRPERRPHVADAR